nr:hypothetical protein [Providencia sp. PROV129]
MATEKIDIAEKDIAYIEGNIQQNVPNGLRIICPWGNQTTHWKPSTKPY